MTDRHKNRRADDVERRSKAELLNELALNKGNTDQKIAHLVSELQVHQAELEMQNQELREAQQTLEEARDRYAALYDFSPVGYLTLDEVGRIHEINLTGSAMLGMERANLLEKPFATHVAHGDSYAFFHHLHLACHALDNTVSELRIVNREGGIKYVRLESAPVTHEMRLCHTVMTDITVQRRVAAELEQASMKQEVLLNAIPAIVFYKDQNLRYVAVSQMLANFLGKRVEDVLGKTDFELFPHEQAEIFQRNNREVLDSGKTKSDIEHRLIDAQGEVVCLSFVLTPFYSSPGQLAGLLGLGIDVTALKNTANLNRDLMLENRNLLQNLFSIQEDQQRQLARELHDELGQWITAISAEAHAIDSMAGKEHKIAESARAINESAGKMHKVIRGMMHQLRPELLDELGLAESLKNLVDQWRSHHQDVSYDLLLDGHFEGFSESTNITVYRIVQEALSNIARHAHASHVVVQLSREQRETADDDFMLLFVEDNGKGFAPEQPQGFGMLGMRERAIAACGKFSISNKNGGGVRIDVRLPINCQIERRK